MTRIQEYFVPEKIAEARKWTILRPGRVTVSSAIRRQKAATLDERSSAAPTCPPSLPACRDFSTWASDRDLWPWIQIFILLSSVILKVLRCRVQIFSWGDNKNALFSNQQKRWLRWIHFSQSLTLAALKGALVTLGRPLWAGSRISCQPEGNFHHHKDMTLLQQKSEKSRRVKIPQKGFSLSS